MIQGACHCGAQRFSAPAPDEVTRCTCSTCTKRGTLAAYYAPEVVTLNLTPEQLTAYQWGDRMMTFFHCAVCGCAVHATNPDLEFDDRTWPARVTLNARLFQDFDLAAVPVRDVEGRNRA